LTNKPPTAKLYDFKSNQIQLILTLGQIMQEKESCPLMCKEKEERYESTYSLLTLLTSLSSSLATLSFLFCLSLVFYFGVVTNGKILNTL
jgi:hypothetical protein